MLYLYYTRISELLSASASSVFSEYRNKKLEAISNPRAMRQSIAAELLLNYAARQFDSEIKLPLDIAESGGKPVLRNSEFFFNISHSGDIVACAICDCDIGLDVQLEKTYSSALVSRFFSASEISMYNESIDADYTFFKIWSMKESYVKAIGKGISYGLKSFSVDINRNRLNDGGAAFWHEKLSNCHFSLCLLRDEAFKPDVFEYINIKELL